MIVYKVIKLVVLIYKVILGLVMVVDVKIGEVLVMVNSLLFNFNNFNDVVLYKCWNWVIIDLFELGLIVKLLVILVGLDYGLI